MEFHNQVNKVDSSVLSGHIVRKSQGNGVLMV